MEILNEPLEFERFYSWWLKKCHNRASRIDRTTQLILLFSSFVCLSWKSGEAEIDGMRVAKGEALNVVQEQPTPLIKKKSRTL